MPIQKTVQRNELTRYLGELLETARFRDYCPNGLQVEGRAEITRIVTGVTASLALIERAIECSADAVLVHHGYFWKGEDSCITGMKKRRLAMLLERGINLYAFHLPLDAHPILGNNAQLAKVLGFETEGCFGEQGIGLYGRPAGRPSAPMTLSALAQSIGKQLDRAPQVFGDGGRSIQRIAWCTGAAQGYIEDAAALGVDAYLSGEVSEQTFHFATENGIAYIAAGHHATERYGISALGAHLAGQFGLEHQFIDIPNPV